MTEGRPRANSGSAEADAIERPAYFDGMFLKAVDFQTEQSYHIEQQRRLNRSLYTPGVIEGLEVKNVGNNGLTVTPGLAIDSAGRLIIISANVDLRLKTGQVADGTLVVLSLEETSFKLALGADEQPTRTRETPRLRLLSAKDADAEDASAESKAVQQLRLARFDTADSTLTLKDIRTFARPRVGLQKWVRLAFLPKALDDDAENQKPPFQLKAAHAAAGKGGAIGVMEIPIPPDAAVLKRIRVVGDGNNGEVTITPYINQLASRGSSVNSRSLTAITTKDSGFDESQDFNEEIPMRGDSLVTLSLKVETTGTCKIHIIAVEFA